MCQRIGCLGFLVCRPAGLDAVPSLPPPPPTQQEVKEQPLAITYSYYNGTGHRRTITVQQGFTVTQFLKAVHEQLSPDFREMRCVCVCVCVVGCGGGGGWGGAPLGGMVE